MTARADFLHRLERFADHPALVEAARGDCWTYQALLSAADKLAAQLPCPWKALAFCLCQNTPQTVIAYLACLKARHTVALLDALAAPESLAGQIAAYQPDFLLGEPAVETGYRPSVDGSGVKVWQRGNGPSSAIHKDLALLLPTSGTTGSPKFVRLTATNLLSNALSIIEYLGLSPREAPIASLPFHYSYGLSVLNSHLLSGGKLVLTTEGILAPKFWQTFRDWGCTSFAGVPYSYQILDRIGFLKNVPASMRTMTQAGGRLSVQLALKFHDALQKQGVRFFVMYGQTEATARISYLPPDRLHEKQGSIGIPIPGGKLSIIKDNAIVQTPGTEGELCYQGPNVMMGYATQRSDLGLGDVQNGSLMTGDLGFFDEDGFFRITGRTKRISKVYGLRINLDEIETALKNSGPVAVVSDDQKIVVFYELKESPVEQLRADLATAYKLNVNTFEFRHVERLPLQSSGKIDYSSLIP